MANQVAPGDVANIFIRFILSKAGAKARGLTKTDWGKTLDAFDNCCAYTGQPLGNSYDKDHAVPINRTHGGLHVYGNVVPASKLANSQKKGLRYDTFLRSRGKGFSSLEKLTDADREAAIARIEAFMQAVCPDSLMAARPELLSFYQAQYEAAKILCTQAVEQLEALLSPLQPASSPVSDEDDAELIDLPSEEQLTLEEGAVDELPAPYQQLKDEYRERRIGAYAQALFRQLFADARIESHLEHLQYREDSFYLLKMSYPVLTKQRGDNPGHYYAKPYHFKGTDYYLCNDWYNDRRDYLESWLADTVLGQR
jgi:hypothetical protein